MKLFQRLLVAPAALGLLAPIAANATEVNLDAISNYSSEEIELNSNSFRTLSSEKPLLISGGEGLVEDVSADYKYRTFISKAKVAARMMLKMTEINYDNFKNSVNEIERKNAYSNIWLELRKLQK